jgi:DNA polymerase-3 subunit gamma/tau
VALALYRTYRPGSLAEVIGQEHVTEPLARALDAGRTHHAYLFSGPRGCGKTSTARILARSLNCDQGPTAQPCGLCRSCIELAPNGPGSIDVVELDAATHRGIDDARELREKAIYAPAASRFKIYIIDEAHQLTNEAANALLKLVEEPPPHLRFIFATTEPDKIIPTIRSRTFHYGFRLVPARLLAEHLGAVCRAEGVPAEGPALAVVARAGAGSVRDSLSVLGQLLAGAGPAGLTYADAVSSLGLTDASLIDAFIAAVSAGSAAEMFAVVDGVISAGHDARRFVSDVLDRLRDLIILRADPGALASGLVDVPDDAGDRMLAQAQSLGLAELSRAADLVSAGLGEMKGATAPRLQLELLCARLALPTSADDLGSVLARLERLERGGGAGPGPAQAPAAPRVPGGTGTGPTEASRPQGQDRTTSGPPGSGVAAADGARSAASSAGEHTRPALPARPAAASGRPAPPRRPDLRTDPAAAAHGAGGSTEGVPAPPAEEARPAASVQPEAPQPVPAPPAADSDADRRPSSESTDAGQPAAPAPAHGAGPTVASVQAAWPTVLDRLAGESRVAWTVFHAAAPVSLSQGVLAVAVSEPGNLRAIAQRGHDERLRQALIDVLGLDVRIDVLHDPDAARGGAAAAGRPPATAAPAGAEGPGAQAAPGPSAAADPGRGTAVGPPGEAPGELQGAPAPAPDQAVA